MRPNVLNKNDVMKNIFPFFLLILLVTSACGIERTDEIAEFMTGTNSSLLIIRRPKHLFLAEYDRTIMLRENGKVLARQELFSDTGGYSRASIFQLTEAKILLEDAFGEYEIDLTTQQISVRQNQNDNLQARTYLGVFDTDEKKVWRYIPATERKYAPTELKGG
jgi:hypothetical protein